MKFLLPAIVAILAFAGTATPSDARTKMRGMNTETFVREAANSNEFEIESSQIALQKSKNEQIKQFAQRMIDDHTKIGEQLKQTLQQANLPAPPTELDPQSQALLGKLKDEDRAAFDRNYVMDMRTGHRKAVRLIGMYARTGDNPALKQLAKQVLPVIKEHLKLAEALPLSRSLTAKR